MIQSGFFNSVNGDRRYNADFFARFFGTLIGNGVFPNPSTGLQVYESSNMTVTVKPGKGWINGYFIISDSDYNLTLATADGVLNRIDRIVMRLDFATREIQIIVKKGTFASSPVAPTLQRDADAYELALADIYVGKGVTTIRQSNITDQRLNNSLCGVVTGLINQVDTTTLFSQYQSWLSQQKAVYETDMTTWTAEQRAEFEAWQSLQESEFTVWNAQQRADFDSWFASIKDIMDENVATNLQNQITELDTDLVNLQQIANEHKTEYATFKTSTEKSLTDFESTKNLSITRSNKDSEGIFTTLTYKRKIDNTLYATSVLSGDEIAQKYTTRTIKFYDVDGTTLLKTTISTLSYDSDGDLVSEV